MSSYLEKYNKDYEYGLECEKKLECKIQELAGCKLKKLKRYDCFDWTGETEKILIELKANRAKKTKYKYAIVGYNKITQGLEMLKQGYKILFIFKYEDGLYKWYLTEDTIKNIHIKQSGRCDRYKKEYKPYALIPREYLIEII